MMIYRGNILVWCLFLALLAPMGANGSEPAVVPKPRHMSLDAGTFPLPAALRIAGDGALAAIEAEKLAAAVGADLGRFVEVATDGTAAIVLRQCQPSDDIGTEGYRLTVDATGVRAEAATAAGLFYAGCTLRQLISNGQVPMVTVVDQPRFAWRGYMLDEARYFHGRERVCELLDELALLKFNVFHWHLTDDQGWRIEVPGWPLLTKVGAWRSDTSTQWKNKAFRGEPHGGFYTSEDVRAIIAYAAERHIMVVPEIEMPGHASAAIAAYPELGTTKEAIEVSTHLGKHQASYDPSAATTYAFIDAVFDHVIELFPCDIIHIGGDEVRFNHWQASA
ncbi:MAG: beta-N-acetylhexosaminidase, partial [Planctomycetota bacterium]